MSKVVGTDTAIAAFKKEAQATTISDAAKVYNIPLQAAYAIVSGYTNITPVSVRRILAVEANRRKQNAAGVASTLSTVEANQYKGTRDTTAAMRKRDEKYFKDTLPEYLR